MRKRMVIAGIGLLVFLAMVTRRTEAEPAEYTPSAEHRARLLAEVRAADAERLAQQAADPALVLVDDGKPLATIVRTEDDPRAAGMLNEWIALMSGVELPVRDADPGTGVRIYVGAAAVDAGLDLSGIESRSDEGLRVRADGGNLYLAGQSEQATARAVARFLETEFGCRWFMDPDWGRHYPELQRLNVRSIDFSEAPGFVFRRMWGAEGAFRGWGWNAWNGHGGTSIPMAHSWGGIVNREDFETNPEWFRLDEHGNRIQGPWLNIGHPEVRKRFMEWALRASENGNRAISFSPPDDHREDFSPESMAYDNPEVIDPSSGRVSMTDRFMTIVNEAAQMLYERNPEPIHGFYAYSDYTLPPTRPELETLSPNLSIWIAPIRFSRYHPLGHPNSSTQQLLKEIVDGWSGRGAALGWRSYNYNLAEVLTPYSRITTWAYDLPYLLDKGCIGNSLESFNTWEISGPHLYLSLRLSYDPRLDPWLIMADYWDKAYGPAAELMERYWMEVDAAFVNLETETGSYHALHHVYTPERLAVLDDLLSEAEQQVEGRTRRLRRDLPAGTENQQYRVQVARRGLTRAVYWRAWFDAINRGDLEQAQAIYDEWHEFVEESLRLRHTNQYSRTYLRRFIGGNLRRAMAALNPPDAPANRVIAVLPDVWKTATIEEIEAAGGGQPWAVDFDDSDWIEIKTFTDTRNAQGLPEYFGEMWYRTSFSAPESRDDLRMHFYKIDRRVILYINGRQVNETEQEGFGGQATLDVSGFIKPGEQNQVTVMIRHIPLPELFLGGLVHPVYLIEQGR